MSYYNRISSILQTGTHTDEDISDILSMVRQLERQVEHRDLSIDSLSQSLATGRRIVREAQDIISTSQPALALSGLLSAMEAARQDVTVALLPGVGAVIELQDLETGARAEYVARDLDDAVTMARLDQGEL